MRSCASNRFPPLASRLACSTIRTATAGLLPLRLSRSAIWAAPPLIGAASAPIPRVKQPSKRFGSTEWIAAASPSSPRGTLRAIVLVDRAGERSIVSDRRSLPADPNVLPTNGLHGAGVVLVDSRWPAGAEAALDRARHAGIPT